MPRRRVILRHAGGGARCHLLHRLVFFFSSRRRHTRCYRDWSSDVCSSDLTKCLRPSASLIGETIISPLPISAHPSPKPLRVTHYSLRWTRALPAQIPAAIPREDRKSVV